MSKFRSSKGTTFLANVRESKTGHCEASIPPYVVLRENIAKKKVRFRIEEIQEDD